MENFKLQKNGTMNVHEPITEVNSYEQIIDRPHL